MSGPITHVAVRWDGRTWSLPTPFRHHHVLLMIHDLTGALVVDCDTDDQGFLDIDGNYLNRTTALTRALQHEQLLDPNDIRVGMLFSEDVW